MNTEVMHNLSQMHIRPWTVVYGKMTSSKPTTALCTFCNVHNVFFNCQTPITTRLCGSTEEERIVSKQLLVLASVQLKQKQKRLVLGSLVA